MIIMNNNGDDYGDHKNGDDGERGVLACWASDATLHWHCTTPSCQSRWFKQLVWMLKFLL